MRVVTFFNNKGGVGKTTLATNVASYLSEKKELKILYLDADPQSNSTQTMVSEELREDVYSGKLEYSSISNLLHPILMGDSTADFTKLPLPKEKTRFNIDIILGHPELSLFEDTLSDSWNSCKGRDVGGFRKTNWLLQCKKHFNNNYDYMIIDVGPSLGALNRSILLNSDYFITPMGCDIYSLMGVENIAKWISGWERTYMNSYRDLVIDYPEEQLKDYMINRDCSRNFRFLGYSIQQYITKVVRGERRGTKAFETVKVQIPTYIDKYFNTFFNQILNSEELDLGYIPNIFSLMPLAQVNNAPIYALKYSDGIVGSHYNMVDSYMLEIDKLVSKIIRNIAKVELACQI